MKNKSSQVLGVLILFCTPGIFSLLQGECKTGSCSRVYQNSQEQVRNKENIKDFTSNEDRMSSTRIIGARGASNHEHAVRIALIDDFKTAHCTGVMQNALYIITAAHCVDKLDLNQLIVTAGLKPYDEQNRSVVLVEIYGDWDPKTREHDIAILKLNDSLTLANNIVKPVELGGLNYVNGSDADVWITGFGLTKKVGGNFTYPGGFMQTTAPVIDIHACKEIFQKLGKTLNTNQICAGGELGFGPCTGDDGAPLTARVYFGELYQTFVVGILSSYKGCATGVPDIYTDLKSYKTWIESIAGYLNLSII